MYFMDTTTKNMNNSIVNLDVGLFENHWSIINHHDSSSYCHLGVFSFPYFQTGIPCGGFRGVMGIPQKSRNHKPTSMRTQWKKILALALKTPYPNSCYTLVIYGWTWPIYRWSTYQTCWFSIDMLDCQRVAAMFPYTFHARQATLDLTIRKAGN
jgi:hypothetical protein